MFWNTSRTSQRMYSVSGLRTFVLMHINFHKIAVRIREVLNIFLVKWATQTLFFHNFCQLHLSKFYAFFILPKHSLYKLLPNKENCRVWKLFNFLETKPKKNMVKKELGYNRYENYQCLQNLCLIEGLIKPVLFQVSKKWLDIGYFPTTSQYTRRKKQSLKILSNRYSCGPTLSYV